MEIKENDMGRKKKNMEKKELSGFNVYEAKEHIKELLKEKGISQKTAYEHIGLSQPDFSKRLSANNEGFFQIWQLWDLSNLLNCSIDELLGKDNIPHQKATAPEDVSLSDVCAALYYFHQIVQPNYMQTQDDQRILIYSSKKIVNELFRKFYHIKDEPEVLSYFSQGFIRDHKNAIRKYEFQTEYEYGKNFLAAIIDDKDLKQQAVKILRHEGGNQALEDLELYLKQIYETLNKDQRICAYNALSKYEKEIDVVKGSTTSVILNHFYCVHEKHQHQDDQLAPLR